MTTLVVSDLHLGTRSESDTLRAPAVREALCAALGDVDRLVLLGDMMELRHGPMYEMLAAAEPFLRQVGEAMAGGEIVLTGGNHDHALVAPALARRRRAGPPPPLGFENELTIEEGDPLARIRRLLGRAELRVAYPGVRLREDVWATHGHYLDPHFTMPTFERMATSVMRRMTGRLPEGPSAASPDLYERLLVPPYAWLREIAEHAPPPGGSARLAPATRVWLRLTDSGGRRPVSTRALRLGFRGFIGLLNRSGAGPLSADISNAELRRAGLRAMGAAVENLGVEARHVIFGHTHRSGPWPRDAQGEWGTPTGARLWNSGNWLLERHFNGGAPAGNPYWPGAAIRLDESDPSRDPEPVRLLDDLSESELTARRG